MNDAVLIVASTVGVLTIVIIGATMQIVGHLNWVIERLDRIHTLLVQSNAAKGGDEQLSLRLIDLLLRHFP